jgi:hypothetical protein
MQDPLLFQLPALHVAFTAAKSSASANNRATRRLAAAAMSGRAAPRR